ncbi:MAG: flagellar motor switch protein FliN [bacterium]
MNRNQGIWEERLKSLHSWLPVLIPKVEATLSGMVDRPVKVELLPLRYVSVGDVAEAFPEGLVGLSVTFNEGYGGWHFLISRNLAGALADLAILGKGNVPYDETVHQEPIKELWSAVVRSCEEELGRLMGDPFGISGITVTSSPEEILKLAGGLPAIVWNVGVEDIISGEAWMFVETAFLDHFTSSEEEKMGQEQEGALSGGETSPSESPPEPPYDAPRVKRVEFPDLSQTDEPPRGEVRDISTILDINLPITIELGRTRMLIRDILDLGPGSVIELDKLSGEPVDIFVNDKKFARGEVVVVEENFGVRIIELLHLEERLNTLR